MLPRWIYWGPLVWHQCRKFFLLILGSCRYRNSLRLSISITIPLGLDSLLLFIFPSADLQNLILLFFSNVVGFFLASWKCPLNYSPHRWSIFIFQGSKEGSLIINFINEDLDYWILCVQKSSVPKWTIHKFYLIKIWKVVPEKFYLSENVKVHIKETNANLKFLRFMIRTKSSVPFTFWYNCSSLFLNIFLGIILLLQRYF